MALSFFELFEQDMIFLHFWNKDLIIQRLDIHLD